MHTDILQYSNTVESLKPNDIKFHEMNNFVMNSFHNRLIY